MALPQPSGQNLDELHLSNNPDGFDFHVANHPIWDNRGSAYQDIDGNTKSTLAIPSAYIRKDICGLDQYVAGNASVNLAGFSDCQIVQLGSVSIKFTLPAISDTDRTLAAGAFDVQVQLTNITQRMITDPEMLSSLTRALGSVTL